MEAALRASEELGKDVADIPVGVIARQAGMSRSTLLRRLGGSRTALDHAVRGRGVDPGGAPVRIRATDAAAILIEENGLAAATLEAIAVRAECSVPSLYANFGTRDGLLRAVFERHSPVLDLEEFFARPHERDLRKTVLGFYSVLARELARPPRVVPAMFAEVFARPSSPSVTVLIEHAFPRMLGLVGGWLSAEVAAGRVRELPMPLLIQQLMAPMMIHLLMRPLAERTDLVTLPDLDVVCEVFADTFVRAVATREKRSKS
ncbi:TetR/AcrR family transcriptional regulator [Mycobacterium vicinigordonae]|uniref:TetR/AcrR family transcriptional regulator n=1 Tax=Mycobacterium vicinigordonae TaxID=1719132 RepID=A0A7D6EA31_9MYCO|nr:TetR/AcrR family transcriptional regulator [Mycobacterium vicinigordonae]